MTHITHAQDPDKMTAQEMEEFLIMKNFMLALRAACKVVRRRNEKWWIDIHTGEPIKRNVGELLALQHSEISEAMEGHRKNLKDDKLTNRPMFEVEEADCMIRIMDTCEGLGYDLAGAWYEKMQYNYTRADHSLEHRKGENGKKY